MSSYDYSNPNLPSIPKDPSAVLDYSWDWSAWLGTDTIVTATVTAAAPLVKTAQSVLSGIVTAWLSGGNNGMSSIVVCRVQTSAGRTDERSILVKVQNR